MVASASCAADVLPALEEVGFGIVVAGGTIRFVHAHLG
jgi:hypothetical protein